MADLNPGLLFFSFLVLLFSLTVHEAAHAWSADRLGDPTARHLGRISLNPMVHIDPIGTVLLPVIAMATGAPIIGWAKPVPVSLRYLRRYPRDFVLVAAAGPASNLALALAASVLLRSGPDGDLALAGLQVPVGQIVWTAFSINLLLAVFNLIPVPPLDGGNMLGGLLRGHLSQRFEAVRPYGILILYALMLTGALSYIIGPPYVFLARLLTL